MKHHVRSEPEFDLFVNEGGIYTAEFAGGDYVCFEAEDADDATVIAMEYYDEVVVPNEQKTVDLITYSAYNRSHHNTKD